MKIMAFDIESVGVGGKLFSIAYSIGRSPVQIIKRKEVGKLKGFFRLLYDPEVTVMLYNAKFDLFKIYELREQLGLGKEVFKCKIIDLYQHVIYKKPFSDYPLVGKKLMILKKVVVKYEAPIVEKITKWLKDNLSSTVEIKVGHKKVENPKLVDVVFYLKLSKKLKGIAPLFLSSEESQEILHIEDAVILPPKVKSGTRMVETRDPIELEKCFQANVSRLDSADEKTISYMKKDVEYLWKLLDFLNSKNEGNPVKSEEYDELTHLVAYTKFYGFGVDHVKVKELIKSYSEDRKTIQEYFDFNPASSKERLKWVRRFSPLVKSSGKKQLERLVYELKNTKDDGLTEGERREALGGLRMLKKYGALGQRLKQAEFIDREERLHVELNIAETFTRRMSGAGGFNIQGIAKKDDLRKTIRLSFGGDAVGQEIVMFINWVKDDVAMKILEEGGDFHTLTMVCFMKEKLKVLFPECDFSDNLKAHNYLVKVRKGKIPAEESKVRELDKLRDTAKTIVFSTIYGGTAMKLASILTGKIEPSEEDMEKAEEQLQRDFYTVLPKLKETREALVKSICTLDFNTWQLGNMADHVENLYGTKKSVALLKKFVKYLYDNTDRLASCANPVGGEKQEKVVRYEKAQLPKQALSSSILGSISYIQQALCRQLGNYPIQSSGAEFTKKLGLAIWALGIPSINIHDEVIIPDGFENRYDEVVQVVRNFEVEQQKIIKYIRMEFKRMSTWYEK
jgi:hypothetical protein